MNPPTTPNHTRRLPHDDDAAHHDASYKAALKGASLAFQQKAGPKPAGPPRKHDNGALIAATSASRDHGLSRSPPQHGDNGDGPGGQDPTLLKVPTKQISVDTKSPSFIAATLAASRSASPTQRQPVQQAHPYAQHAARRGRMNSIGTSSPASSVTSLDLTTDASPIPPTNALISMFERHDDNMDPVKKATPTSSHKKSASKPILHPLTPPRAMSPIAKDDLSLPKRRTSPTKGMKSPLTTSPVIKSPMSAKELTRPRLREPPISPLERKKRPPTPPPARVSKTQVDQLPQPKLREANRRPRPSTPPPAPRSVSNANTVILSPQPRRAASQKIFAAESKPSASTNQKSKTNHSPVMKPKVSTRKLRPATPGNAKISPTSNRAEPRKTPPAPRRAPSYSSDSSDDTFVSASSAPSPEPDSPRRSTFNQPTRPASTQSVPTRPAIVPPALPRRPPTTSNVPFKSLTSAIMAGSLASSRLTPVSSPNPPSPPSRHQTPRMRHTLRQQHSKSDDESHKSHHQKKPLMKPSKKHLHHEGARKRWREEITPRERKRYEGVWASNKGLLLADPAAKSEERPQSINGDLIVNVVARDLWARSRLPFDELAEVWDLVSRGGVGRNVMTLDRTEFVVGMWLIDQRLRGRKIPQKVSESVWSSAMDVIRPKSKHKHKHKS